MNKRNALRLLAVLGGAAIWMIILHLILFPGQGIFGVTGLGMTAVALMFFNRDWLQPSAPPLPRQALLRSVVIALVLGASVVLCDEHDADALDAVVRDEGASHVL